MTLRTKTFLWRYTIGNSKLLKILCKIANVLQNKLSIELQTVCCDYNIQDDSSNIPTKTY